MLPLGIVFIFIAGISFLGFAINSLFSRLRITSILPLMAIGLIIGPVLNIVNVGPGSTISQLSPYVVAIAISFVLFEVGINMRLKNLGKVITDSSKFVILSQVMMGIGIGTLAHFSFGWTWVQSFIFSFAVSGPSSLMTNTLVKSLKASENIKSMLLYEGVFSDILQLIVPLVLISLFFSTGPVLLNTIGPIVFTDIFGAIALGAFSALFWLYVLNRFSETSKDYSWMLTVTMVIATYGIASQLGLSTALSIFVFGVVFANIGATRKGNGNRQSPTMSNYISTNWYVAHTKDYQREIVFFVSTFFFVYLGMLFSIGTASYEELAIAIVITVFIIVARIVSLPVMKKVLSKDPEKKKVEKRLVYFNITKGLAPAIVATDLITLGIQISGFTNTVFLVILITNLIFTIGIFAFYKPDPGAAKKKA